MLQACLQSQQEAEMDKQDSLATFAGAQPGYGSGASRVLSVRAQGPHSSLRSGPPRGQALPFNA